MATPSREDINKVIKHVLDHIYPLSSVGPYYQEGLEQIRDLALSAIPIRFDKGDEGTWPEKNVAYWVINKTSPHPRRAKWDGDVWVFFGTVFWVEEKDFKVDYYLPIPKVEDVG